MSKIDSIRQSGLQGIQEGLSKVASHANNVARGFDAESDTVEDLVGIKLGEHQVKASSKVLKVAERLEDAVLDILA